MTEMKIKDQPQVSLEELIQSNDTVQIEAFFEELQPVEMARMIANLNKADHVHLFYPESNHICILAWRSHGRRRGEVHGSAEKGRL